VVTAADYHAPDGGADRNFYTEHGRDGSPVGRALLMLDTDNPAAGWRRLADLPGVSRAYASVGVVAGRIHVLGGLHAPQRTGGADDLNAWYFNAAGGWVYEPETDRWERLPPVADHANARAVAVGDRYLVLLGGFNYAETWQEDGTRTYVYSPEETRLTEHQRGIDATMGAAGLMRRAVVAYDAVAGREMPLAPLLDPSAWPMGAADGDTVYCLGGEGGRRLWHPATFQIGRIKYLAGKPAAR
jgi:hypothetical protein